MHGDPREAAGFTHFPYANPDAPKGGRVAFAVQGSFDSLNPLIVKGVAAEGVREYVYESLLARAYYEPFSLYGLIAESVETPDDRSFVEFTLNPEAKFSDGTPITVADVMFSHALLKEHGRPNHRSYYKKVSKVEATGPSKVKFTFDGSGDREMPLIMGLMPVLPRHLIDPERFEKTTLAAPVGSGPYKVAKIDPGKSISFQRDPNYWGRDLPVNRGHYNFDEIKFDYYRDGGSMFEAFKSGLVRLRKEEDPTRWTEGYTFPALRDGRVVKEELPVETPAGMTALVFNTRRPIFADQRVREAMIKLFDFEWVNRTLYHGQYARTESYFDRSDLSSDGRPADAAERALLAPFPGAVKPAIMDGTFSFPVSDGTGENCEGRAEALRLLEAAGYRLTGGKLIDTETGEPFKFEILATTRAQERLLLTYARALKQVGIEAESARSIRPISAAEANLRFRHDPIFLAGVAVARERAVVPVGERGRDDRRHVQLSRREKRGRRRDDRGLAQGRGPAGLRHGGSRARPPPAFGRLCHSAVPFTAPVGRALERFEAARHDPALRLSDRHMVGRTSAQCG